MKWNVNKLHSEWMSTWLNWWKLEIFLKFRHVFCQQLSFPWKQLTMYSDVARTLLWGGGGEGWLGWCGSKIFFIPIIFFFYFFNCKGMVNEINVIWKKLSYLRKFILKNAPNNFTYIKILFPKFSFKACLINFCLIMILSN